MSNGAKVNGKKLVLVSTLVLILFAASVRIFAGFYLRDQEKGPPTTQPATEPIDPTPM